MEDYRVLNDNLDITDSANKDRGVSELHVAIFVVSMIRHMYTLTNIRSVYRNMVIYSGYHILRLSENGSINVLCLHVGHVIYDSYYLCL